MGVLSIITTFDWCSTICYQYKRHWLGERRPLVISASGSLDLEDLDGVGRPNWFQKGSAKAAVAPATTQFHWQDPSLSTENSRGEKLLACFSVLGVSQNLPTAFLTVQPLQGWPRRSIAFGDPWKKNGRSFNDFTYRFICPLSPISWYQNASAFSIQQRKKILFNAIVQSPNCNILMLVFMGNFCGFINHIYQCNPNARV